MVSQEGGSAGLDQLRAEYVVRIRGQLRPRKDPNPRLPTGTVELLAREVRPSTSTQLASTAWPHPLQAEKPQWPRM